MGHVYAQVLPPCSNTGDSAAQMVVSMRPPDDLAGVDVVIATRDRPELLRRAIDAILRQDYAGQVDVVVVSGL